MRVFSRILSTAFVGVFALSLASCGGGAPGATATTNNSTSTTTSTKPILTLAFADSSGAILTTPVVTSSATIKIIANLQKDGSGLASQLVSFVAGTGGEITFSPSSGTVLTDSDGNASVTISANAGASGATSITASAVVNSGTSTVTSATYTATAALNVNGGDISGVTLLEPPVLSPATIGAYGTTTVTAQVLKGGVAYSTPTTVTFSQSCGAKGAMPTTALSGTDGRATVVFTDAGCSASGDTSATIIASVSASQKSNALTIKSPTSGSLRFMSAVPQALVLAGTGGTGQQENATVVFKLVDSNGNAVSGVDICLSASTYVGGLKVDGYTPSGAVTLQCAVTKPTDINGQVSVLIASGSTPTPVVISASTTYPVGGTTKVQTSSGQLTVSSGLPSPRGFNIVFDPASPTKEDVNPPVYVVKATVTDWFGNPVPDGTSINMIARGALVCAESAGVCTTKSGSCTCNLRPTTPYLVDGRGALTAYVVGNEDFLDANGNNKYDDGEYRPYFDLALPFLDADLDGWFRNSTDDIPVQQNGTSATSNSADGVYGPVVVGRSYVLFYNASGIAGGGPIKNGQFPEISIDITKVLNGGMPYRGGAEPYVSLSKSDCAAGKPQSVNIPYSMSNGVGQAELIGDDGLVRDFNVTTTDSTITVAGSTSGSCNSGYFRLRSMSSSGTPSSAITANIIYPAIGDYGRTEILSAKMATSTWRGRIRVIYE